MLYYGYCYYSKSLFWLMSQHLNTLYYQLRI